MIFRFPFTWGAPSGNASVTTAVVAPFWTAVSASGQNWTTRNAQIQPRFEQIVVNEDTGPQFVQVTHVIG